MFPLCDARGRVLGFGARAVGERQQPRYLNSSDNAIYHSGRHEASKRTQAPRHKAA